MDLIDIATIQMVAFQQSAHHHFAQTQTANKTQTVIHLLSINKKVLADGGHFKAIHQKVSIVIVTIQMGRFSLSEVVSYAPLQVIKLNYILFWKSNSIIHFRFPW